MVAAIIAIITALISYFGSKKAGATDAQAAVVAAGVGVGTYYVATNTEWGKNAVSKVEGWVGLKDDAGQPVIGPKGPVSLPAGNVPVKDNKGNILYNSDGTVQSVPPGATITVGEDGNPATDSNGNVIWKLVDSTGKVLQSWGGEGTAKVVGTAGFVQGVKNNPLPWLLGAGAVLLIAKA